MKNWGDAKRWLFEDMVVYAAVFIGAFGFDFMINILKSGGLAVFPQELSAHPLSFGTAQIMLMVFSGMQFLRKLAAWKYYA